MLLLLLSVTCLNDVSVTAHVDADEVVIVVDVLQFPLLFLGVILCVVVLILLLVTILLLFLFVMY